VDAVAAVAFRRVELLPEGAIGAMSRDPHRLRRGREPCGHLWVGIALCIPRQEATLAGRHPRQHRRDVLRSACRAVGVEPLLLRVDCQLLSFAASTLPLLANRMLERLPHVG
jgi:hypothetical protein